MYFPNCNPALRNLEAASEAMTDMPPRAEEELDPGPVLFAWNSLRCYSTQFILAILNKARIQFYTDFPQHKSKWFQISCFVSLNLEKNSCVINSTFRSDAAQFCVN